MTRPASLARADQAQLDAILRACPELAAVTTHVRAFATMMTSRSSRDLQDWMTSATAGLTLPWSSGAVEGHVNRIKMLKRQMYGRASPDLLRRRILLAD
jgi:transposase